MKITFNYKKEIHCGEQVFDISAISIGFAELAHEAVEKVAKCFPGDWARISLNMSTCELTVCCPREDPPPYTQIDISYPFAKRELVSAMAGLIIIEMMEHGIASEFFGIKRQSSEDIVSAIWKAVSEPVEAPTDDPMTWANLLIVRVREILASFDGHGDIPY